MQGAAVLAGAMVPAALALLLLVVPEALGLQMLLISLLPFDCSQPIRAARVGSLAPGLAKPLGSSDCRGLWGAAEPPSALGDVLRVVAQISCFRESAGLLQASGKTEPSPGAFWALFLQCQRLAMAGDGPPPGWLNKLSFTDARLVRPAHVIGVKMPILGVRKEFYCGDLVFFPHLSDPTPHDLHVTHG